MMNERDFPRAKAFLEQFLAVQKRVQTLVERIACIDLMLGVRTPELTDVKVKSSPDLQKNERLIAMKADLEREKKEAEAEMKRIRGELEVMIGKISDPVAEEVLIHYYLDGMNLKKIGIAIKYSETQTRRFRDIGLEELENVLTEQVRNKGA